MYDLCLRPIGEELEAPSQVTTQEENWAAPKNLPQLKPSSSRVGPTSLLNKLIGLEEQENTQESSPNPLTNPTPHKRKDQQDPKTLPKKKKTRVEPHQESPKEPDLATVDYKIT